MSEHEVFKALNKKIESLNDSWRKDEDFAIIENFLRENPFTKPIDFLEMDIWKFIECIYYLSHQDKTIAECFYKMDSFAGIADNLDESICALLEVGKKIIEGGMLEDAVDYLEEKNIIKSAKKISKLKLDYGSKILLTIVKAGNSNHNFNLVNFYKMLEEEPELIEFLIEIVRAQKITQKYGRNYFASLRTRKGRTTENDGEELNKSLRREYNFNFLFQEYKKIVSYVKEVKDKENSYSKVIARDIAIIEKVIDKLKKALESQEVTNAREIVKPIRDEQLKCMVLKLIYEHNEKYYQELKEKLTILKENTDFEYQAILKDYDISIEINLLKDLKHNTCEEVKKILEILNKYSFSKMQLLKILKKSNLETVNIIKSYVDKGILTENFLFMNIDIFYIKSMKLKRLQENIDLLNTYNINPAIFVNSIEVLFQEKTILEKNLRVLESYDLLKSLRTTDNYNFLLNKELSSKIDKIIELGYEKLLEEDLNILNMERINRLEVLKVLNIVVEEKEELEAVLTSQKFYVQDSEIFSYVPSTIHLIRKEVIDLKIEDLEEYKISNRLYDFNGVRISINKVKRLLSSGYSMEEALFKNMNLSSEEYTKVIALLKPSMQKKI